MLLELDALLDESFVNLNTVTLLSLVAMSSSLSQPNSIVSGSTSGGTDIEQITSCFCPIVLGSRPSSGLREICGDGSSKKEIIMYTCCIIMFIMGWKGFFLCFKPGMH